MKDDFRKYIKPFIPMWLYAIHVTAMMGLFFYVGIAHKQLESNPSLLLLAFIVGYVLNQSFISPKVYTSKKRIKGLLNYTMFKKLNNTTISFADKTNKLHNEEYPALFAGSKVDTYTPNHQSEFWVNNKKILISSPYYIDELNDKMREFKLTQKIKNFS